MINDPDAPVEKVLASLQERAKELNCLYEVEEVLNRTGLPLEEAFQAVVDAIPPGWQYPDVCEATLTYEGTTWRSADFEPTRWKLSASIEVQDRMVGSIDVYYTQERPREDIGPFLAEEERLIRTIAERLAHGILFNELREIRQHWQDASQQMSREQEGAWRGAISLLHRSDRALYLRISRRLINHLCWIGVDEAQELLQRAYGHRRDQDARLGEINAPAARGSMDESQLLGNEAFELASRHLTDDELLALIQEWMLQDKASFLPKVLFHARSSLTEIADAIRRFHHVVAEGGELSRSALNGLKAALIRRFLTEHLEYIGLAKQFLEPNDFGDLLDRVIGSPESYGRIGGKSSGLFLAEKILSRAAPADLPIGEFKVPRSWYLASDGLMDFVMYNELEGVFEQKYRDIAQVRREYPNIVQLLKSSRFPPELVRGLNMALDDFGDSPLIVRSSSLLEDRLGSAFSGKYKSLFLANQGSKKERMSALLDAITEVYASIFGPDPIEYRRERNLLDFHEEMGVLIQEVVGRRVGKYFLPAFAGVAFSNNEFRWSPRVHREDGLLRLVPGLGTRAVDRVSNDYPILAVPRKGGLRVTGSTEEIVRYSPRMVDVINLDKGVFETVELRALLDDIGTAYPGFETLFSELKDDVLMRPAKLLVRPEEHELVASFEGLLSSTEFPEQVGNMLRVLQQSLGTPVDIEFAHDGQDFYLLQCRPQSYGAEDAPAPIPKDLPEESVLFRADRFVSNGRVPDITHVVYVDPDAYGRLEDRTAMLEVGRAVSELNKMLPKRQFILIGPGRWGSRGDIKLGVSVTYSDINNTAMLIEVAPKRGDYQPELSFGTHFFQDLVEASIRYLPLYPGERPDALNERFLARASNLLSEILPGHDWLADVVRVIDVPQAADGRVVRVLLNADLDEAVGALFRPEDDRATVSPAAPAAVPAGSDTFWRWRLQIAERIAAEADVQRLGIVAMYVLGSTKNASAGPNSDIDLLVHFRGTDRQRELLLAWLKGWSQCLAEANFQRTGYRQDELLDVHLVTDDDIRQRTSWAVKIGAVTDAARELPVTRPAAGP